MTTPAAPDVPHLAFPFRVTVRGKAALVEQDSIDEIAQNVEIIVRTRRGERLEIPEFGVSPLLFRVLSSSDMTLLESQIREWEPRADTFADGAPDRYDELIERIRLEVSSRSD